MYQRHWIRDAAGLPVFISSGHMEVFCFLVCEKVALQRLSHGFVQDMVEKIEILSDFES
jgi:hypothetical protein